jgi:hypothetical protein
MPDDTMLVEVREVNEIAAANPIAVECGADRDIMLTQHDDTLGEERVIWFNVRHAESVAAAILAQARMVRARR